VTEPDGWAPYGAVAGVFAADGALGLRVSVIAAASWIALGSVVLTLRLSAGRLDALEANSARNR
jgi:hypothetical protein